MDIQSSGLNVTWVFKPIGWNPTDCIRKLQKLDKFKGQKLAYAGRLDPMACGLMPLIKNTGVKERDNLQNSYKTYQFNSIIGLKTDTYDILGIPEVRENHEFNVLDLNTVLSQIGKLTQIREQEYPPYSSKSVYSDHHGKMVQLWRLAREGLLPNQLPKRDINIEYIKILDHFTLTSNELLEIIQKRILSLAKKTDFRQQIILEKWKKLLSDEMKFSVVHCEAKVSVGT